jgi:hypothetical protein
MESKKDQETQNTDRKDSVFQRRFRNVSIGISLLIILFYIINYIMTIVNT